LLRVLAMKRRRSAPESDSAVSISKKLSENASHAHVGA
jgi:hypothetical protein